jgi:hypothetical protein
VSQGWGGVEGDASWNEAALLYLLYLLGSLVFAKNGKTFLKLHRTHSKLMRLWGTEMVL